ncbi:unnamed protein product [Lathyrus oleraceus]
MHLIPSTDILLTSYQLSNSFSAYTTAVKKHKPQRRMETEIGKRRIVKVLWRISSLPTRRDSDVVSLIRDLNLILFLFLHRRIP